MAEHRQRQGELCHQRRSSLGGGRKEGRRRAGVIVRVVDDRADWIDIERMEEAGQSYASSAKDGPPSCESV